MLVATFPQIAPSCHEAGFTGKRHPQRGDFNALIIIALVPWR